MPTINELQQEFYATQLGIPEPWPSLSDLSYLYYLGAKNGDFTYVKTVNSTPPDINGDVVVAGGGTLKSPYLVVASNDASAAIKAAADYVCDGTSDQVQINAALVRAAPLVARNATMPVGAEQVGKVVLTGGRFNCSDAIVMHTGTHLQGMGWLTEIRAVACNAVGLIKLNQVNDHIVMLSDLWLNGNYASGGTCNAIDFDMSGATDTTTYPPTSPDAYHHIHDIFIDGFKGAAGRHGIRIWASSGANNRGNIIDRCQIRNISGDAIQLTSSSDSFISNCHVGSITGTGYRIAGGNNKISNCKSFYCDAYGFYSTSGRGTLVGFESQDDATGLFLDALPWSASGITVDTSSVAGLRIGSAQVVIAGFSIFNRSGGRYATTAIGLHIDAAHTDLNITGVVTPANITTPISGTASTRSFMRVSNGTSLVAVG